MSENPIIKAFTTVEELQKYAAGMIARLLNEGIGERGNASIALSGGSTPKGVYQRLGGEPFLSQVDWMRVHLFWGDERCVPPDHRDSNFRMTDEALLRKIHVPAANIHRIRAELPPADAATLYEEDIRSYFGGARPVFDVMLLGLGEDGHTASLFPGTSIVSEQARYVADVFVPEFNARRISLTLPVINAARMIIFLATGNNKAAIARDVIAGKGNYPAGLVKPGTGMLFWLLDDAAASLLTA